MEIRLILLVLGLCALAQINARPTLEKRGNLLKDSALEKRGVDVGVGDFVKLNVGWEKRSLLKDSALEKRAMLKLRDNLALEKRGSMENSPMEKRAMLKLRDNLALEKRGFKENGPMEKRGFKENSLMEKRAMLKLRDNLALEKRGFKENGPMKKRAFKENSLMEKRAMLKLRDNLALEKRGFKENGPMEKRGFKENSPQEKRSVKIASLEKRKVAREERDTVPAQYHYVASAPQVAKQPVQQYYYYVQNPDGTRRLVSAPAAQAPQVQQQYSQGYQEVPYQAPASSGSGGGGILSLLSKPVSSIGKVVGVVGDLAQGIIDIPFALSKDLVQVVLPSDSGLAKLATGILDTKAAIVKAPVELVKDVAQLPFEIVSDVVDSLDEE